VAVLPGVTMAAIRGPHAREDGDATVWVVPEGHDLMPPP
jgi:hypothetical protein